MRDLSGKVDGTGSAVNVLTAVEWNDLALEAKNLIVNDGIAMSSGDLDQVQKAIADNISFGTWYTAGGTADAITLTAAPVATKRITAYRVGVLVRFRPTGNNTSTTPTVNVNGLGAKTIVNEAGGPLGLANLTTARDAYLRYDGTNFRLAEWTIPSAVPPSYHRGYIFGATLTQAPGDLDHDITINPGELRDNGDTTDLQWITAVTKRIDATFALGTGVGGRPAAVALAADTWYVVFCIGKTDGSTDFGFDTDVSAVNLLAAAQAININWILWRRLGYIRTDASANIVPFTQNALDPDHFIWDRPQPAITTPVAALTTTDHVIWSAPFSTAHINVHMFILAACPTNTVVGRIGTMSVRDDTVLPTGFNLLVQKFNGGDGVSITTHHVPVDFLTRLKCKWSNDNPLHFNFALYVMGWRIARSHF